MAWKNVCPVCPDKKFKNLDNLKAHMEAEHGGYTPSEIAASGGDEVDNEQRLPGMEEEPGDQGNVVEFDRPATARPQSEPRTPKRNTRANMDLNRKMNDVLRLQIRKLLGHPLTTEEQKRLQADGDEVQNAMIGFQFNFEEKVVSLDHWFFKILILIVLTVAPFVPTLPEMVAKVEEAKRKEVLAKMNKAAKQPMPIRNVSPEEVEAPKPVPAPAGANDEGQPAAVDAAANGLMVQP